MGEIAFIPKELAKQLFSQARNRLAVIHVARGNAELEDFAAIIDDQMQFEAKEPAGGCFPAGSQPRKHLVAMDALIQADIQGGGVDERNPAAVAQAAAPQVHDEWHQGRRNVLHKARVTDQPGKF